MGNTLPVEFGLAAIDAEGLGQDDVPDVLALSFSSTDYVGHQFGAHAMETEDTYRRLDDNLTRLFDELDARVGMGRWVAFLTADHGAVTVPGLEKNRGLPVGYWNPEAMKARVDTALQDRYGRDDLLLAYNNDQFFLDRPRLRALGLDADEVARFIAGEAETAPEVQRPWLRTCASAASPRARRPGAARMAAAASGDVGVMLKPGYPSTGARAPAMKAHTPTTPTCPFILGQGVPEDLRTYGRTHIRDIALTLSALIGFPRPSGCTGHPIGPFDE